MMLIYLLVSHLFFFPPIAREHYTVYGVLCKEYVWYGVDVQSKDWRDRLSHTERGYLADKNYRSKRWRSAIDGGIDAMKITRLTFLLDPDSRHSWGFSIGLSHSIIRFV